MLRQKKFRPFELKILLGFALLLAAAAIVGAVLGIYRAEWRMLLCSVGIGGVAALYFAAARRGRPLGRRLRRSAETGRKLPARRS